MGRGSTAGLALCASILVHASMMLWLRRLDLPAPSGPQTRELTFSVEGKSLVNPLDVADASQKSTTAPEIVAGGPTSLSNVDRDKRDGRRGDGRALEPGLLLFPFASNLTLQDTDLNNLKRNQAQRIDTARDRATQEERRATPQASDAFHLASGDTGHHERRKPSRTDSAQGSKQGTVPSLVGAAQERLLPSLNDAALGALPIPTHEEAATAGATERKVAQGVLGARGQTPKASARVDFARPNVDRGPAATTAEEQDARIRDDIDAELLAARMQRSIVEASVVAAERTAPGRGGHEGGRDGVGRAAHGEGASALPYTPGTGMDGAIDTRDGRYIRWFVEQKARVQAGVVFPFARAIAKDQGTSVYRVIVTRSGTLAGPMHLVRSSGYADFDAAARAAIRNAAPFAPLPSELMQDNDKLAILIPIAFANPMVE